MRHYRIIATVAGLFIAAPAFAQSYPAEAVILLPEVEVRSGPSKRPQLAAFPDWVVDYVIVHELAHLAVADHSPEFWALVSRYPRTERARGYLIAKSGEGEDDY